MLEEDTVNRTAGVLAVLYLLFNEGYSASAGADLVRQGLCAEAIRLARALSQLMPDEPEAQGLLALMFFHDARRATRTDSAGDLVRLEDQDRSRWDRDEIEEGTRVLDAALRRGRSLLAEQHQRQQLEAHVGGGHGGDFGVVVGRRDLDDVGACHRMTGQASQDAEQFP